MTRRRKPKSWKLARDVTPGDVLNMAVGPSLVLRCSASHGGRDFVVCSPEGGSTRTLWFWDGEQLGMLKPEPRALRRILDAEEKRRAA